MPRRRTLPSPTALLLSSALLAAPPSALGSSSDDTAWPVVGRQGLMRFVIVPQASAGDRQAYEAQIERLCQPGRTCFLNFYTNSRGVEVALPLPDAIEREATATFRRSMKQGAESLRFSCRLQLMERSCF